MRHLKKRRKFGRKKDQRKALLKALVNNLVLKEKIKTTEAKAKETSKIIEKFITKAKNQNLATTKHLKRFFSEKITKKLLTEIAPKYLERKGGYTRIYKLPPRKSDGAKMAIIELV